jgi:hypothetical protein
MRRHLTYANVISTIALFIVLGGGAYAAVTITGRQIKNNSVTSADIRNRTLRKADFRRGVLPPAPGIPTPGPAGPIGPRGEQGIQGLQGPKGDQGPGAVAIAASLPSGPLVFEHFDVGPLTVSVSCNEREGMGRPQVQLWAKTDEGAEGTLHLTGIRSHSSDPQFTTGGDSGVDSGMRTLEARWAPADGWASTSLDLHYRSGSKTATVSLHMVADDGGDVPGAGPDTCTAAGTGIPAG